MKTILVLTDFSENATHAAETALGLANKLHANVLLFNSYQTLPIIPYYSEGPLLTEDLTFWEDESKDKLNDLAAHLELINMSPSTGHKTIIHCQNGEGNLGGNIEDIANKKDIELIVMGTPTQGTIQHILNGSDTSSVIQHATRPVLVVPSKANLQDLHKIIFATDFGETDINGLRYLTDLGKFFDSKIEITHVKLFGEEQKNIENEFDFTIKAKGIDYPNISYNEIRGKDLVPRLNKLFKETNADLLAMVHHQYSFLKRMITKSHTKTALANQKIPLLIFPSRMENILK